MIFFRYSLFLVLFLVSACTDSKDDSTMPLINENYALIPQPQYCDKKTDLFVINKDTRFLFSGKLAKEAAYFLKLIHLSSDFQLITVNKLPENPGNIIILELEQSDENDKSEQYQLSVDSEQIRIKSSSSTGIFRGIQTLRQMLPPEFHAKGKRKSWGVRGVLIKDFPAFKWRGLLFDCCRHFFSKKVVLKYIDLLAFYKMNTLHWHLTEDQGWRIAIDKYPELTRTGAWRKDKENSKYGGYYSKKDIKEIIAYAAERHINVVPEIELPGHSQAAIAAYPHLSCTGRQLEVGNKWGVFKDVYCAGNDSTFVFLEDVLNEVIELFPSQYIHIGGDECPKYRWEHCNKCQNRIKSENLKDEHELQSYFIKRIARFLESRNKTLIGWDEILEGGLAENAVVQSWRGMNGALEAADNSQFAIASPTSHAYFDYNLQAIDLAKVYQFNPIPSGLDPAKHRFILGGECNMWTEHVPDEDGLDNKVFPRILAMSEVLWSDSVKRNYEDFYQRVQMHYPILDFMNVKYGAETVPVRLSAFTSTKSINIKLLKGAENLDLYYTLNDSLPSPSSSLYEGAIPLKKSATLKVLAFKNNKKYGSLFERKFSKHLANGLQPELSYSYSQNYTGGGDLAVTNGARGSLNFRDGNWQAVQKVPMQITIDLKSNKTISKLSAAFYQKQDSWIFLPPKVDFYYSVDGKKYTLINSVVNTISPEKGGEFIKEFSTNSNIVEAEFVRIIAHNITYCPNWHPAAGSEAWLFIDEFVVE